MALEECRVYTPDGELKKTHTKEALSKRHWSAEQLYDTAPAQAKKTRVQTTKRLMQNWVCCECRSVFQAAEERDYCYSPCMDPNEKTTRPQPKKWTGRLCARLDCRKPFQPTAGKQKYCHDPCINAGKKYVYGRNSITCVCGYEKCKKVFVAPKKRKYCLDPCNRWTAYNAKRVKYETT